MAKPVELSKPGRAKALRKTTVFLSPVQMGKLDKEVMRRKAAGEDVDEDGVRFHMNRSVVIRDLIDEKWPK